MLKKAVILLIVTLMIIGTYSVYASEGEKILNSDQAAEIIQMKESSKAKVEDYIDKYGSTPYGIVAYVLNIIRIYSIPTCFIGIAVGSIYQYVIGIRKLDVRDKGFALIVTFVTILLICQTLPLIFAIVVNFWRG
ncbi:MAG: hypothetical protein IKM97_05180 [Clostridia bacterium]|nr:hypothetical protein [Clostridia bacterium]